MYNLVMAAHTIMKTILFHKITAETLVLQPRDRIHHICNELLTTEESYVERLNVLVKVNFLYQFSRAILLWYEHFLYILCITKKYGGSLDL